MKHRAGGLGGKGQEAVECGSSQNAGGLPDRDHHNQCHLCMLQLKTKDELMEHYRLQHLQFYTWMTSRNINS